MMNELIDSFPDQPIAPNSRYEFRVNGRLSQKTATWFEDMTLTVDETTPPQTILQGVIRDQTAIHGLIRSISE